MVQEILVDQELVDQTEDQVVQEILALTDQVVQVEFQQCLVFNHQDVLVNAVVQVVAGQVSGQVPGDTGGEADHDA